MPFKQVILLLFICPCFSLYGQSAPKNHTLSFGYYGYFFYQPGFKIATQHPLKKWQMPERDKKNYVTQQHVFISPQLAVFWRPQSNTNLLVNADIGFERQKMKRHRYSAFSIGLGYLMQWEILSATVSLGDGSLKNKNRELRHYFIPTVNYEFGHEPHRAAGWYVKLSLGGRFSPEHDMASVMSGELGLRFRLCKKITDASEN